MTYIILPIRNESKTILTTATNILFWSKKNLKNTKIIFINDHSTDNLEKIVNNGFDRSRILDNTTDVGKGSALTFAYKSIRKYVKTDDTIIFIDGDGQICLDDITPFVKFMELYNAQVVIGNKRHAYSVTKYSLQRKVVSVAYNIIVRALFGIRLQDTQCGIKMFKVSALDKVINKITTKGFAWDVELLLALKENSIRIVDAPVKILDQTNKGSVSLKSILSTFYETISIFKKYRKGFYKL